MAVAARLFGREVWLRQNCLMDGTEPSSEFSCYVNLYVKITEDCNCSCRFCTSHQETDERFFNNERFKDVLYALKASIRVNKIVFTGGEPSNDFGAFLRALADVREIFPNIHVTVNTNGWYLGSLGSPESLSMLSCVALSRHHFHDHVNAEIFGVKYSPSELEAIEAFPDKNKLHLRCNLIRGYIDSPGTVVAYLHEMSQIGVVDYGFVSLMKLNPYCKDHFVDPYDIDLMRINGMHMAKAWKRPDGGCTCRNYLYVTTAGQLVKIYDRHDEHPERSCGNLVFDVDHLLDGFNGNHII